MSTKGTVSPSPTSKSATVVMSSPRVSTGVRSTVMSWPADREQRRTVLAFLDPGNIGAEAEADHQLHPHLDPAANAAHQPHHVGGLAARRHEVDQLDRAVGGLEPRFQDQGVAPIAARGARDLPGRRDQPAAVLRRCRAARQSRHRNRRPASTASRSIRRGRPARRSRNRRSAHSLRYGTARSITA